MPETPRMGLPWPDRLQTADVSRDIHALADGVEAHSHICLLERMVVQSFAPQLVTFPTVVYDPDSMYTVSGTRNGWVVFPFPGIWQAAGTVRFKNDPATATNHKYLMLGLASIGPLYDAFATHGLVHAPANSTYEPVNSGDLPLSTSAIFKIDVAGQSVALVTESAGGSGNTSLDPTDIVEARLAVSCLRNLS